MLFGEKFKNYISIRTSELFILIPRNPSFYYRYSDIYKCTKGGRCQITLKTRKNCQFCRFQACENAGMKRSWVLADGEVKTKKVATSAGGCVPSSNNVTSTTNPSSANMPSSSSSNTNTMCSILSPQDEGKIRNCIEKMQLIKQQTEDLNPQVSTTFINLFSEPALSMPRNLFLIFCRSCMNSLSL